MIIGHERIISDLRRLAEGGHLSHGYLFFGPEMVGKRLVALALANFLENGEFDEPGPRILGDAFLVVPDEGGTIGVDAVRGVKHFLSQRPNRSARRTVVIDRAETMTAEAGNALLKVTEEPPRSGVLILVTRDPEAMQATLRSRLQRIYFSNVPAREIAKWLESAGLAKGKDAAALSERAFGEPGRAAALLGDEKFLKLRARAEEFLKTTPATRRDFIKKLIAPDDFSFRDFLDALIARVAEGKVRTKEGIGFWHKLLSLRGEVAYFPLNPRIQLENLFFQ
ncbi:MAG: hypothetical protein AAB967_01265, partial [Patescibacteria group bacterium]